MFNRLALVTLLAAGAGLSAQDARFGLQGTLAFPQGDLKDGVDSKMGYGLGVHGTFAFDQHAIRPRLDYTLYSKRDLFPGFTTQVSSLNYGVDYLYFTQAKDQGLYLIGGASAVRWNIKAEGFGMSESENTTKLGLSAGVGYQWNKTFGTELRYQTSSIDQETTANNMFLSATVRF